jgi:YbbR domain-containing protein
MRRNRTFGGQILNQIGYLFWHINKQDMIVFGWCILIAAVLWVFNSLRKDRTEQISYPIDFQYDKEHFIALSPLPTHINLNVKGSGWQILRKMFRVRIKPIAYELDANAQIQRPYILASQIRRDILKVLHNVKLEEILTDTLRIPLDRKINKVFTIRIDSQKLNLANNYRVSSPIRVSPPLIALTGPESIIKALPNPLYVPLKSDKISTNYSGKVKIDIPKYADELLGRDEEFIDVAFEVLPYTTQKVEVILEKANFPADKRFYLTQYAKVVPITFMCKQSEVTKYKATDFKLIADFKTFDVGDSTVALKISLKPHQLPDADIIFPPRVKVSYAP